MKCSEARGLIDGGVVPGSRDAAAAQLGFHLASCPACRAYRAAQADLLAALLANTPADIPKQPTFPEHEPDANLHAGKKFSSAFVRVHPRPKKVAALLAMGVVVLALTAWLGGKWARTQQNIAAMIVTAAPTSVAPSKTAQVVAFVANTPLAAADVGSRATASPELIATRSPISAATPTEVPTLAAPTAQPTQMPPSAGNAVTVLILGDDRRPGETEVPRTDCVMLARIDPQRGRVALLSFPRDLIVDIPGYNSARINAAYVLGELYHAPGGGLGLARDTVSNLTGVPIDYAVLVDFQGFIGLIDSIGGVTVNVPKELYDARFPTMDYGYTEAHFLPGPQHMDGATALTYSRVRHPDSDFERIKRQQAVLVAIGVRLRERGDLQNLLAADQITAALRAYVQMDIPQDRVLGLVWALRSLALERVERYTLEANMVSFGVGDDQYAELATPDAIEQLVHKWYGQ